MSLLNEKFTPMLLGEADKPFDDDEYIYEIKYDGVRSLVFVNAGKVVVKNKYGVDVEITNEELNEYATCTSCKKPSSYKGKMYWFNGKLYCKDCLIQELLKDNVIYDNWYSNF